MAKDDENVRRILAGLDEVAEITEGRGAPARVYPPASVDVRGIRARLNMTQSQFAARFGFAIGTLRDWEQGRRQPEASARVLLRVIEREPDAVERALAS